MQAMDNRVAIIGGGASGLVAAISAAARGASVTIYERNDRVGKKILSTGNGRCNLTNMYADTANYHGEYPGFIKGVKSRYWVKETLEFFKSIGLMTKTEDEGRVYPCSDQASSVLDLLRIWADKLGIRVVTGFDVSKITMLHKGFKITSYDERSERAACIILATGGKAAPASGSTGSGYELAADMGHSITDLYPSLVQIKTEEHYVRAMKGIKADAVVRLGTKEKRGEILFTEYGISGPPIFSLSAELPRNRYTELSIEFLPDLSLYRLKKLLMLRRELALSCENFLVGILNKRIGMQIMKAAGITPLSRNSADLTDAEIEEIAGLIKDWRFEIRGTMSWNNAQVTAGGIRTAQIDQYTMQSKLVKGLFFAGEIMDIDGDCGGFNLQWAWSSGMVAGEEAAKFIEEQRKREV